MVLRPTIPQRDDGILTEPPPSVPMAAGHKPDATIEAGPDDEPPVYLSNACGFLAVLYHLQFKQI